MTFSAFGLSDSLLRALETCGYHAPFPVQAQALPPALAGRDLMAVAKTGSGKTAAFALPILQRLLQGGPRPRGPVRALVLVPTRELAAQVGDVFTQLGRCLPVPPRIRVVFGGGSVNPQMMALRGGAEVLVATPGRLLDLAARHAVALGEVETLVLDEADRMLDLGFRDELAAILALLPAARQNLFFSATLQEAGSALLAPILKDPVTLGTLTPPLPPGEVDQRIYRVETDRKGPLLRHLLRQGGWDRVLVFVSSHRRADHIVLKLRNSGIRAEAMHGDLSQGARTGALALFRNGGATVLVATDLASRGLDIDGLACVINYDLPRSPNDYLHRVGRTGRAGAAGLALALVAPEERAHMSLIEKRMGRRLPFLDAAEMKFE